MSYMCEWSDCSFTSDNFDTFYEHVRGHTTNFFRDPDEESDEENECQWRQCFSDPFENELQLIRHVLFHAYHSKLKDLGLKAQTKAQLAPCTLDNHARNLIPEFPGQFFCLWENCGVATSCPSYYYRHVDGHAGSTVKEDADDVVSCKWQGDYLLSNMGPDVLDCRVGCSKNVIIVWMPAYICHFQHVPWYLTLPH